MMVADDELPCREWCRTNHRDRTRTGADRFGQTGYEADRFHKSRQVDRYRIIHGRNSLTSNLGYSEEHMSFENKTAIVTGSGRGIGKVIVSQLAAAGANVVVSDIDQSTCEDTAREIGASAIACQANVTSADDITRLFKTAAEKYGSIDIVVNNAGITRDGLMIRMDEKDWDTVLDINLKGAFLVTKTAARIMMKQRSGRIINISSVVGLTGNAGQANYSAAKAGLVALTKTAAKELGSRGVTVNAVAPGFIETEMTATLPEAARASFLSKIVLGRAGTPADVAAAVVFLASDEAAYITGQVLSIDGGMVMA